jgi:hypothetical protein
MPRLQEVGTKGGAIVDFAVADQDERLDLVRNRLTAALEVDDAEPTMSERDARISVVAFAIRAAMR